MSKPQRRRKSSKRNLRSRRKPSGAGRGATKAKLRSRSRAKLSRMEDFEPITTPWPLVTEAQRVLGKYGLVLTEIEYMYEEYTQRKGDTHNHVDMRIELMPDWRSNLMYTGISSVNRPILTSILSEIEQYDLTVYEASRQFRERQITAFAQQRGLPEDLNRVVGDFLRPPPWAPRRAVRQYIEIESAASDIPFARWVANPDRFASCDYLIRGNPRSWSGQRHHGTIQINVAYSMRYLFKIIVMDIMTRADREVIWNVFRYYHDMLSRDSNKVDMQHVRL
jgi:hypothetical protein